MKNKKKMGGGGGGKNKILAIKSVLFNFFLEFF